jgi:hypothetical protein
VGDVLIGMLPLMVAAALVPAPLIIVLTLLRGPSGLAAGAAFLVGMTLVRVAQGALFGFVLVDAMGAEGRAEPRPVVATLLLILGLLLWITAVKTLLKEEDPDAPPPRWLERLRTASPLAAFAIGAGFIAIAAKQWVFTLGALGVVAQPDRGDDRLPAVRPGRGLPGFAAGALHRRRARGGGRGAGTDRNLDGAEQPGHQNRRLGRLRHLLPLERALGTAGVDCGDRSAGRRGTP